ncbi:MAG TPA: phage tail sheath C-terminal domain-containing protein [Methanotrichaceae archaeon]|nr:phage tail sheath C-terminal domain-containing protein [Methanotrichaceae archaeon]
MNGISNLVTIKPGTLLLRPDNIESKLEGGKDCEVELQDYEGYIIDESTGKRTGWLALDRISDISIYCEPYEDDPILQSALTDSVISHCELMKDRFAILQTSQKATSDVNAIMPCKDSKYAALYHPWVQILDPITNLPSYIPPCGHMAGIYARIDGDRGVHKAPANVNINGAIGLKFDIKKGEQDILNPRGVNCIRAFQGQGIKVWGARTISRDPLWKYINVRRLFIFLEKSIEQGTQWVVFEPNNEALWSRVKQTISQFLTTAWRSGALMGATEEEAFFVKCDRTTMTQDDIDNDRLIVVVGVAPVKPAEFVIFRIAQVANASNVSE